MQSEQDLTDLWREHYLRTYDQSLREYCFNQQIDYDSFVEYISNIYGENDVRTKNTHPNDVRTKFSRFCFFVFAIFSRILMMMTHRNGLKLEIQISPMNKHKQKFNSMNWVFVLTKQIPLKFNHPLLNIQKTGKTYRTV